MVASDNTAAEILCAQVLAKTATEARNELGQVCAAAMCVVA